MIKKEQLKNLESYSTEMYELLNKIEKQIVETIETNGKLVIDEEGFENHLIRTDDDILYCYILDFETNCYEEYKILSVATDGDKVKILIGTHNEYIGEDTTDEELLKYSDYWYSTRDVEVLVPTLMWHLCDNLCAYIDDVE